MYFFPSNQQLINNKISEFLIGKTKREYDFHFLELIKEYKFLKKYAKKGKSYWYNIYLKSVIEKSNNLHIDLSNKLSSITLIKQSKSDIENKLNKKLENELRIAKKNAEKGDNYMMNLYIKGALGYALELSRNIDSEIEEIKSYITPETETNYLNKKLEEELRIAKKNAKKGDDYMMNLCIKDSLEYALKLGKNIDSEIEAIKSYITPETEKNYLNKKLEEELRTAKKNAEKGDSHGMSLYIESALEIALKVDRNIDIELEKIINLLL